MSLSTQIDVAAASIFLEALGEGPTRFSACEAPGSTRTAGQDAPTHAASPIRVGGSVSAEMISLGATAKRLYDLRRRRERLFGESEGLFRDPAWDIMLDLFIQTAAGRTVCVSSAAIASRMPPTTGLRWIRQLAHSGLVHKSPDPSDARRCYLELTKIGLETMVKILA